jgi:hypothetical protein
MFLVTMDKYLEARLPMSVTLSFSPEAERRLHESAARSGQSVEDYIQQLVERQVLGANGMQVAPATQPHSLDDALAPIREEFEQSGMSDEDLATLVEDVREKIWLEKQTRKVS